MLMSRLLHVVIVLLVAVVSIVVGLAIASLSGSPLDAETSVTFTPPPAWTPTSPPSTTPASSPTPVEATAGPTATPAATATARPTARPTAPAESTPTPSPTELADLFIEYIVQRGDSLKSIGRAYGVTVSELLAVNDFADPDSLTIGEVVRVPVR
jgi:LysM repeat protein